MIFKSIKDDIIAKVNEADIIDLDFYLRYLKEIILLFITNKEGSHCIQQNINKATSQVINLIFLEVSTS